MAFEKGKQKTGGRMPGAVNKLTGAFREAVQVVYDRMGGHEAFLLWARDNQTEYYRIAARLIPIELRETEDRTINVIIRRDPVPTAVLDVPALEDHSQDEA